MPTSGLVISTSPDTDLRPLLTVLGGREGVACGEPVRGRLPIVTETASKAEDKRLWEWLWTLPSVVSVDVAFIYLDSDSDSMAASNSEERLGSGRRVQTSDTIPRN